MNLKKSLKLKIKLEKIKDEELKRRNKADLDLQIKQRLKQELRFIPHSLTISLTVISLYGFSSSSFIKACFIAFSVKFDMAYTSFGMISIISDRSHFRALHILRSVSKCTVSSLPSLD